MGFQSILVDIQYVNLTFPEAAMPDVEILVESNGLIDDIPFTETASMLTWAMPRAAAGSPVVQTLTATGYPAFGSFYLRLCLFTLICGYYIRRRAIQHICIGGGGFDFAF